MRQAARLFGSGALLALLMAGSGSADPDHDDLIVNGEIDMIERAPAPPYVEAFDEIISGWSFRSDETQALQMDDFDNPGMLGVERARVMFDTPMGSGGQACSSCHETPEALRGVRATYPKWDEERQTVQTVEMQVNECLTERMGAEPLGYDSPEMVDMAALIASVSRGMVVNVAIDGPARPVWEQGRELYYTRFGQLELACANCHEDNAGRMIRADHLSQGQINGFPTYRLNNAALISVHNRFRGCIRDTRAETFPVGSPELVALELYVASRGNGLTVEGPAVRN
ncbi:hypothetical protein ruthe_01833 [Rubellimicrobium thermophilum DSM 16684]|uniref:SoxAX cytochrome complex subunit A n=1 Tax=Rubellimicrobium thermophilum DSM 16684 TaxID=1123069 RepID=S9QTX8_9RHOB|nr:sulfur oxidation c-type cytochrome SoxA [Rubellimicrobium thermophilum]EPX84836.1 hypothetical protein ruthe_01833 [Rubellimicrobium thermophilum DSM 16684]